VFFCSRRFLVSCFLDFCPLTGNEFQVLICVLQRRDYTALMKFLPPKHEYVISVRMSPLQIDLYNKYLDEFTSGDNRAANVPSASSNIPAASSSSSDAAIVAAAAAAVAAVAGVAGNREKFQCNGLFKDYHNLMRIWTHPWVLKLDFKRQDKKVMCFCSFVLI
jgi:transcriptional regulator ATRX